MTKNEYLAKRKTLLNEADQLINAGKLDEYEAKENEIKTLDAQYEDAAKAQANAAAMQGRLAVLTNSSIIKDGNDDEGAGGTVLAATQEPTPQIARNASRGKALKANNAVTVGAGTVVTPRHSASDIRPTFNQVSSLIDRVGYKELKGGETFRQPYIVGYGTADYTAAEGDDYNTAEPTFAYADINKTKVTAYAEDSEEIMKLPDADYDGEVMKGITIASRKKLTREILIGTGAANRLTGIFSTAATAIDASTDLAISAIDASTLDDIIFSFGGDEEVEDAAVLILNKKDLKAFAKLRGTDGKKIYNVVSNGNTGTIDGVPFIINSACKAITDAATTAGQFGMAYGPLSNYLLTVFSDLDVQRSTDFKFKQGMIAHRGSIFAGGNVVSKNGFLRVKKSV
jgi:HK97 family phage major capsid protein